MKELLKAAGLARMNAYAPHSKYLVGAAIRTADGAIFAGCNVENASFGATICAERSAVCQMVATAGKQAITEILVLTKDGGSPCGVCLQVLSEFATSETVVWIATESGHKEWSFGDFLPHPFALSEGS